MPTLAARIKSLARQASLDLVGITTAEPLPEAEDAARAALAAGRLAALPWMTAERIRLAHHPQTLFPAARSVVCVGLGYLTALPHPTTPSPHAERLPEATARSEGERLRSDHDAALRFAQGDNEASDQVDTEGSGRVARYAWGADYHGLLRNSLRDLVRATEMLVGRPVAARICVDTAPVAERALAQRAGLGWPGKNTALISSDLGSWFVLGEVLWDLELEPDGPAIGSCGDCDLCLRACPANALAAPYALDVARCLSYLTIEHRGDIPSALRPLLGDRLVGCDDCQEICPRNIDARVPNHPPFRPRFGPRLPLAPLFNLTDADSSARFSGSALRRAGAAGLRRNADAVSENYRRERSQSPRN